MTIFLMIFFDDFFYDFFDDFFFTNFCDAKLRTNCHSVAGIYGNFGQANYR